MGRTVTFRFVGRSQEDCQANNSWSATYLLGNFT